MILSSQRGTKATFYRTATEMDWEVIWWLLLCTSGLGQAQMGSVDLHLEPGQNADSTFVSTKSPLVVFFFFLRRNITQSVSEEAVSLLIRACKVLSFLVILKYLTRDREMFFCVKLKHATYSCAVYHSSV